MYFFETYNRNNEQPHAPYEASYERDQTKDLSGLAIGSDSKGCSKAVPAPLNNHKQEMGDATRDKKAHGNQDGREYHGPPKQSIPTRPGHQVAARREESKPHHQKLPEKAEHCSKGTKEETKSKGFDKTTIESGESEKGARCE
jgi:hypothetical protein